MPKLLDQVRDRIRARHYSIRTEGTYLRWIKDFILFHGKRHPMEMGAGEVRDYLSHLAVKRDVAASTQNQALSAILFLYRDVLDIKLDWVEGVERAKKPARLPVVFTREEVRAVLARLDGTKWLMASLLYGAGLRLMECVRLRVKDVEFTQRQITVRDGKGGKDRVTVLPNAATEPLTRHLIRVRALHEQDTKEGFGAVSLPHALARKYPNAGRELGWQFVFTRGYAPSRAPLSNAAPSRLSRRVVTRPSRRAAKSTSSCRLCAFSPSASRADRQAPAPDSA
jgi:integron integrase